jgi:hypothetical protein
MYSKRDPGPTPVTVKIVQLNPYRLIFSTTVDLYSMQEEKTILRFNIDSKGNVGERSTLPYSITNKVQRRPRR